MPDHVHTRPPRPGLLRATVPGGRQDGPLLRQAVRVVTCALVPVAAALAVPSAPPPASPPPPGPSPAFGRGLITARASRGEARPPAGSTTTARPATAAEPPAAAAATAGPSTSRPLARAPFDRLHKALAPPPAKPGRVALPAFLVCVRHRESRGDYTVVNPRSGAGGAFQFLPSTWRKTADHAGRPDLAAMLPQQASPADQDAMAVHLYHWQGRAPWAGPGC
jgi:hypothetical protein